MSLLKVARTCVSDHPQSDVPPTVRIDRVEVMLAFSTQARTLTMSYSFLNTFHIELVVVAQHLSFTTPTA